MNVLTLPPRLAQIAACISPCRCMADIGTDHAYLPAALCLDGICQTAIAADVRPGPLRRAAATVKRYGLEKEIALRLGNGTAPLAPGDADTIVIAGMGGLMIAQIIQNGLSVIRSASQVILQPMTAAMELREFLSASGFTITGEYLAKEDTKIYNILTIASNPDPHPLTPAECYLGRELLRNRPPLFDEYLQRRRQKLLKMLAGLKKASCPASLEKYNDCKNLLKSIDELCPPAAEESPCGQKGGNAIC